MNLQVKVNLSQESFLLNKMYWRGLFTKTNGGRKIEAANTVVEELFTIWIHCNVYCLSVSAISWRISKLVDEFCRIDSIPKKKEDR